MNPGDRACVDRLQAGDQAALGELYDRYAALLHPVALRITGNAADADEALFEAWLLVCRRSVPIAAGGAVSSWLLSIVRDRALARRRAGSSSPGRAAPHDGPIEVSSERVELAGHAVEALGLLDDHERTTLELGYFEGLTQSETAARMSARVEDVRKWTRQGIERLSAALPREEAA